MANEEAARQAAGAAPAVSAVRPRPRLTAVCCDSKLLALHQLAVLRHDEHCQETLINLLIRSFLHYNLYEQVCHLLSCQATCLDGLPIDVLVMRSTLHVHEQHDMQPDWLPG